MIYVGGAGAALLMSDAHFIPVWSQGIGYSLLLSYGFLWFWSLQQHPVKVSYAGAHDEPTGSVTTTGPYAIIRHPIYFSYALQWLAAISLSHLILMIPMFLAHLSIMSYYARIEESQFLSSSKSSQSYAAYMRAVPYRILPLIPFV